MILSLLLLMFGIFYLYPLVRGGWNVEFHYYDGPFFHYIKNGFLVDHYIEIDKDHYYENNNVEKNVKRTSKVSVLSDFHILTTYGESTYGVLENFFFKTL